MSPRYALSAIVLFFLTTALWGQEPNKPLKEKASPLEGKWTLIGIKSRDGKLSPWEGSDYKESYIFTKAICTVEVRALSSKFFSDSDETFHYSLVDTTKPHEIDLVHADGRHKGKVIRGLVILDGDVMTLLLGKLNKERPKSIERPNDDEVVMVYKKQNPHDSQTKKALPLEGKWKVIGSISSFSRGKLSPSDDRDVVVTHVFKDGRCTEIYEVPDKDGKLVEDGRELSEYKFDDTKKPHTIDFVPAQGVNKGRTQRGIFKIEGDTLTISTSWFERPKSLEKPGDGEWIDVLKRIK